MRREKTVLMAVCFVVVSLMAGLMVGGCGPGTDRPEPGEQPQYGGTLTIVPLLEPLGFDDGIRAHHLCPTLRLTNDILWEGDWAKGQAGGYGSGETGWFIAGGYRLEHKGGGLAESVEWDDEEKDTVILRLHRGVYWHDKPPTNGRELIADDVVFSVERQYTLDTGYQKMTYPWVAESIRISAMDDYTVLIECRPEHLGDVLGALDFMTVLPRDAIEQFGDLTDWRNSIGTGPFILNDYMPGSSLSFVRNDNYWGRNPVGPGQGDQLPYVDEVKWHIIPDESTRDAAFRTGKLDILGCDWERAQEFLRMPELEHARYLSDMGLVISMRQDKEGSPFADVRVRQALLLAMDNQKILDEYYGGEGALLTWPLSPVQEYLGAYALLEELPRQVQELYEYHPEKARQLLADAGYPNGFKATIVCQQTREHIDVLSMVKDMWAKVGVDLEIDPRDYATYTTLQARRAYDDMFFGGRSGAGGYYKARNYTGTAMYNTSHVDDPVLNQARDEMVAAYPDEARADQIHRELMPYLLEQAYAIPMPAAYSYRFWWPWVRNYSGEVCVGYYNWDNHVKYVWIDQELKEAMGY